MQTTVLKGNLKKYVTREATPTDVMKCLQSWNDVVAPYLRFADIQRPEEVTASLPCALPRSILPREDPLTRRGRALQKALRRLQQMVQACAEYL